MLLRAWFLVLGFVVGTSSLVAADLKELRTVQADAVQAGDLWTMLQVEAWADAKGLKLRPALPGLSVLGDPIFACPQRISWVWDRGESVVALAGVHLHYWSEDGRPLRPSTQLPFGPDHVDFSAHTDVVGITTFIRNITDQVRLPGQFELAVCDAGGGVRFQHRITVQPRESVAGLRLAEDGSALALASVGSNAEGTTHPFLWVATAAGVVPLAGWSTPEAVGPEGRWLVARDPEGRLMLRRGAELVLLRAAARGAGQVAVLTADNVFATVSAAGELKPIALPVMPGGDVALAGLGKWLLLSSGTGAVTLPGTDLLGNPTAGGAPVAPGLYGWRWSDLVAPHALHAAYFPGSLSVVRDHPAASFNWHGERIDLIDWRAEQPLVAELATAPAPVVSVESRMHGTVAMLTNGQLHVLDGHGQALWSGTADTVTIEHPGWAFAARTTPAGMSYLGLRLARDAQERREIPFALEPGAWRLAIDPGGAWALAWQPNGVWRRLELPSGKLIESGDATAVMPSAGRSNDPPGRFALRGPRCYVKANGYPTDPIAHLDAIDAWRVGRTMVVLSAGGMVHVSGRRPDEMIAVGRASNGTSLMQSPQGLAIVDPHGVPAAVLAAGPRLTPIAAGAPLTVVDLPIGPWRVDRWRFVPPRSGTLVWNRENRLRPRVLRNPDNDALLGPMGPVVLIIDANAAKVLGRPR